MLFLVVPIFQSFRTFTQECRYYKKYKKSEVGVDWGGGGGGGEGSDPFCWAILTD